MDAGTLRHRITIQRPVFTQDTGTGAMTPTWVQAFKLWAAIEPLSTRDFIASQAHQSRITARIVIRAIDGLTPDMRVIHGTKKYAIEGILPDKDSGLEYLTLQVSGPTDL